MALRFLLDTNVVSQWVRPQPDEAGLSRLQAEQAACAMAAPTLQELAFGLARLAPGRRRDQLETWLTGLADRLPVLPVDAHAAWWLGVERGRRERLGRPLPDVDGEIAAVAATTGLTLVTRNGRDFDSIEALRVETWHSA